MGKLSIRVIQGAAVALLIATTVACSTKKNTFIRRAYHNLSAHYNTYWNGNESLKDGIADLGKNVQDNYTHVLPVANYGTESDAVRLNAAMERAIAKASIVIQRHSMVFGKRERVKWIDDSYMLIGKAYFYKHDYTAAKRTFDFVMRQYNYNPIQYDAMLWQARTLLQQKKYSDAGSVLDLLQSKIETEKVPFNVKRDISLVYADYFILQKNYAPAKEYLIQGITLNNRKKVQARLYFILGQIADQEKNLAKATEYYSKVIKSSPSYELAFNARINLANSFDIHTGDKRNIEKGLVKMSKEFKNKDFRDQIYYALAQLAFKENDDSLGIRYLRLSVAASVKNDFQKTTSALNLAEIYYGHQNYRLAQAYYDSTMQFLPKEYPNYEALTVKTATLTALVKNLVIVQTEDSLQRLAKLTAAELASVIDKMIEDFKKAEQLKRNKEALESPVGDVGGNYRTTMENAPSSGGGGWYFYNTSAMSFGYTEFLKKWGRRKLEDNWRLSNKRPVYADETLAETEASESTKSDTAKAVSTDMRSRKTYLQNIPLTADMMQSSNDRIAAALFNLGFIYLEGLDDVPKSISAFENLLKRYPKDKNALKAAYQLFLTYKAIPDSVKAEKYRTMIVNNYPESDYARIITDPNYNIELQAKKNRIFTLYSETYRAFTKAQYKTVIIYSNEAIATYRDKDLLPKFEYLRALSLGKTESTDTMLIALRKLVKAYPGSEITPMAQSILSTNVRPQVVTNQEAEFYPASDSLNKADSLLSNMYSFAPNSSHFYAILLDSKSANVSALSIRITDYIAKYFSADNLSVNTITLDEEGQMITVSSFRNMTKAMNFYQAIKQDTYVFPKSDDPSYKQFIISTDNYPVFSRDKNPEGYLRFFKRFYLKEGGK